MNSHVELHTEADTWREVQRELAKSVSTEEEDEKQFPNLLETLLLEAVSILPNPADRLGVRFTEAGGINELWEQRHAISQRLKTTSQTTEQQVMLGLFHGNSSMKARYISLGRAIAVDLMAELLLGLNTTSSSAMP